MVALPRRYERLAAKTRDPLELERLRGTSVEEPHCGYGSRMEDDEPEEKGEESRAGEEGGQVAQGEGRVREIAVDVEILGTTKLLEQGADAEEEAAKGREVAWERGSTTS